jgi:RHS repeat-associated protein
MMGSVVCATTACFSRYRYTGKERDSESGNDYFGARYYASSMGRFMSPDPSQLFFADQTNPQSFNLYSYGRNNPLIYIDPSGLDACAYDNGDGTAAIVNAADGGGVGCSGNGFYITTTQQVTGVGFNGNGDLSVYGANGNLYSPDGSAYNPTQTITVGADGSSSTTALPTISSGIGYISTQNTPTGYQSNYPDYKGVFCGGQALADNGMNLAIHAAGAVVPGVKAFGTLGRLIGAEQGYATIGRAYQGVVADQMGAKAINSFTSGASAGAGIASLSDTSSLGLASTSLTAVGLFTPFGQAASVGSLGIDGIKTYKQAAACYTHP